MSLAEMYCGNPHCRVCIAQADADFVVDKAGLTTDTRAVVGLAEHRGFYVNAPPTTVPVYQTPFAKPAVSESTKRKATPIFSGVMRYFPNALAAVARLSKAGNDKHNPGQPLHWSREKSTDHGDCIARHQVTFDQIDDETGEYHATAVAWRALAQLELLEEAKVKREAETKCDPQEPETTKDDCGIRWRTYTPYADFAPGPLTVVEVCLRSGRTMLGRAHQFSWIELGNGSIAQYRIRSDLDKNLTDLAGEV